MSLSSALPVETSTTSAGACACGGSIRGPQAKHGPISCGSAPRDHNRDSLTAPNPGSESALALGCTCPPLANNYGRWPSDGVDLWRIRQGCPVHTVGWGAP